MPVGKPTSASDIQEAATHKQYRTTKNDMRGVQERLDELQENQRTIKNHQKPYKNPVWNTNKGVSTLTGVNLTDLTLRIKKANPDISHTVARKQAKELQQAAQTLTTGGGGLLGNLKRDLFRKTLGSNLGTKVSRTLTSKSSQEKASQTLLKFEQGPQRVFTPEQLEKMQEKNATEMAALKKQLGQLEDAMKNLTAARVGEKVVQAKQAKDVQETKDDVADAVSALKGLGFKMDEIKERFATLPKGLSTQDQIKHALKPTAERLSVQKASEEVNEQIRRRQNKAQNPPPAEMNFDDKVKAEMERMQPGSTTTPAPEAIKPAANTAPSPKDDIVDKEKKDLKETKEEEKERAKKKHENDVDSKLAAIQKGIKSIHSDSFIGMLVLAIAALIKPLIDGVKFVKDKITNWLTNKIETVMDWFKKIGDEIDHILEWLHLKKKKPVNPNINPDNPTTAAEAIQRGKRTYEHQVNGRDVFSIVSPEQYKKAGIDLGSRNKEALDYFKQQGWTEDQAAGIVANIQRESNFNDHAIGDGGKAYGIGQWHPDRQALFKTVIGKDIKDPKTRFEDQLKFYDWELKHTQKKAGELLKKAQTANEAARIVSMYDERPGAKDLEAAKRGDMADKLVAQLQSGSGTQPSVVVLPTQTVVQPSSAAPAGGNGSSQDSLLALLSARSSDPTSQGYVGSLFDHPAAYNALGRV